MNRNFIFLFLYFFSVAGLFYLLLISVGRTIVDSLALAFEIADYWNREREFGARTRDTQEYEGCE